MKSVLIFSTLLIGALVSGYPSGPPTSVCTSMRPSHGVPPRSLGFGIQADVTTFSPGDTLIITVTGARDYRGLFIQVREMGSTAATGQFVAVDSGFQTLNCANGNENALAHSNRADKSPGANIFLWTAPSSCGSSNYVLRATIVELFADIQVGTTQDLTCVESSPDPPAVTPEEEEEEIEMEIEEETETENTTAPECVFPTVLQDGTYNSTTFVMDANELGGWTNVAGSLWTHNTGITPSFGTGPNDGFEGAGSYYLYFETSSPKTTGDTAILETNQDIVGCFCFSFAYHFRVTTAQNHRLQVVAGDTTLLDVTESNPEWETVTSTIETDEPIKISFIGTRGLGFRGDMAIDNIVFTEGRCEDDDENSDEEEESDGEDTDEK